MKKKVYMVRHGQTIYNRKDLCQGMCDSPLSDLGKKQAQATRKYFEDHGIAFSRAYCSPLHRTEQTLKEITDLPFERINGLREFDFGQYEAIPNSLHRIPESQQNYFFKEAGGESREEARERILQTMNELVRDNQDEQAILVVSHGAVMMYFLDAANLREKSDHDHFGNCMIFDLEYEHGKWKKNRIISEHTKCLEEDTEVSEILAALEKEKRRSRNSIMVR